MTAIGVPDVTVQAARGPAPDHTRPSVVKNIRVIGRVFASSGPGSFFEDCDFEPALEPRRPSWMPEWFAARLRRLVTGYDYPALTIENVPTPDAYDVEFGL